MSHRFVGKSRRVETGVTVVLVLVALVYFFGMGQGRLPFLAPTPAIAAGIHGISG